MRLDKWLKVSRLIKRRTVANEACDNERVSVNGRPVRASYDVKVGDKLELKFGPNIKDWPAIPALTDHVLLKLEVLVVADNVGKADAAAMYREIL